MLSRQDEITSNKHYINAVSNAGKVVYIGSFTNPPLKIKFDDLKTSGEKSIYYGHMFDPGEWAPIICSSV